MLRRDYPNPHIPVVDSCCSFQLFLLCMRRVSSVMIDERAALRSLESLQTNFMREMNLILTTRWMRAETSKEAGVETVWPNAYDNHLKKKPTTKDAMPFKVDALREITCREELSEIARFYSFLVLIITFDGKNKLGIHLFH